MIKTSDRGKWVALPCLLMIVLVFACAKKNAERKNTEKPDSLVTSVVEIEARGHVVTDLKVESFTEKGWQLGDMFAVTFSNGDMILIPYVKNYDDVPKGAYLGRFSSTRGLFKIAINLGNLAEERGYTTGTAVLIRKLDNSELPSEFARIVDGEIVGRISMIEAEFGNAATNIPTNLFAQLKWQRGDTLEAEFAIGKKIRFPYVLNYGDVPVGDYLGRFDNDTGFFKIAINRGNIAETLKLEGHDKVVIRRLAKLTDH